MKKFFTNALKRSVVILLIFLISLFCINSRKQKIDSNNALLVDNMNGVVNLSIPRLGEHDLFVKANPTTGYNLYLKNFEDLDKNILTISNVKKDPKVKYYFSDTYITYNEIYNESPPLMGAPGYYQFKLNFEKDFDEVSLQFVKIRPWIPNVEENPLKINIKLNKENK